MKLRLRTLAVVPMFASSGIVGALIGVGFHSSSDTKVLVVGMICVLFLVTFVMTPLLIIAQLLDKLESLEA